MVRIIGFLLLNIMLTTLCYAHGYEGLAPVEPIGVYTKDSYCLAPFWDRGNMVFQRKYPKGSEMSDEEKYILFGAESGYYGRVIPWKIRIFEFITSYHLKYGEMPSSITEESLNAIAGKELDPEEMEKYKCPITDQLPRLDCVEFTPGGIYIQELSPSDLEYYSQIDEYYHSLWFDGIVHDEESDKELQAQVIGPIYYIRFYGERDVLLSQISYKLVMSEAH